MKTLFGINCGAIKAVLIVVVLSACGAYDVPAKYARFVDLPEAQAEDEFRKLPVKEQIDAYLYLSTKIEPPKMGFSELIAENGCAAVPEVLAALREEHDDARKMRLILIFGSMARSGRCNLSDERSVVMAVQDSIQSTTNQFDREMATEALSAIQRADGTKQRNHQTASP